MTNGTTGVREFRRWMWIGIAAAATMVAACGGGGDSVGVAQALAVPDSAPAEPLKSKTSTAPGLVTNGAVVVNTATAGTQLVKTVGALADGGYSVAWLTPTAAASGSFSLQRYDALGGKVGVEVQLPAMVFDYQSQPAIAVFGDGSAIIAYASSRTLTPGEPTIVTSGIYTRRFDSAGTEIGTETLVASTTQNRIAARTLFFLSAPAVLALDDGGYVVGMAYVEQGTVGQVLQFQLQRYDAQGQPVGAHVDFGRGGTTEAAEFKLIAAPGGQYVTAVRKLVMGQPYVVFGFTSAASIGTFLDADLGLPALETTLLPLSDGRFALWSRNTNGPYLQMYDSTGNPVGAPTAMTALPFAAGALADGGYATFTRTSPPDAVQVQRFDAKGKALGDALQVQPIQVPPQVASLLDGGVVIAWSPNALDGNVDVWAQLFEEADLGGKDLLAKKHACQAEAKGMTGQDRKTFMAACLNA